MSIFSLGKKAVVTTQANPSAALAEVALNTINDGVVIVDAAGNIKMSNPAAAKMLGQNDVKNLLGLSLTALLKLENKEGMPVEDAQNPLVRGIQTNTGFSSREYVLVTAQSGRQMAIALSLIPTGGQNTDKIVTFRDITKELEEEGAQMEFISTASHEMRTPVAAIEGYLALALNPQTATIDARAQQYLTAAHQASQHLGRLFHDLLDTTKLDDGKMKVHYQPIEVTQTIKTIADAHLPQFTAKRLKYSFGTPDTSGSDQQRRVEQLIYSSVDVDFLREIMDNLIENAIKYTPEGGAVWVNARGDGDKVLINVTDTGIGISPEDLTHVFQKFYRVDNSQTQTIGGTGLGLYLVKTRVEAMGGRVWAESGFGEGTTFYVSLPRISAEEYQKRRIAFENERQKQMFIQQTQQKNQSQGGTTNVQTNAS